MRARRGGYPTEVPELPDVEIFRRRLAATSLHRDISRVRVHDRRLLHAVSERQLTARLTGRSLERTHRHGKHLLVDLSEDGVLVLHFGMTGYLDAGDGDPPAGKHARLTIEFSDGHWMTLVDQRRLGRIALADDVDEYVAREKLGPDVLSLSAAELRDELRSSRGGVKAAFMDQSRLAGLGNIYTDEVLFRARVDPRVGAAGLDEPSYRRLHRSLHRVVDVAVARRADPARLPRTWLLPHRYDGEPCPRGNGTIRAFRAGGRRGFWCPDCQSE